MSGFIIRALSRQNGKPFEIFDWMRLKPRPVYSPSLTTRRRLSYQKIGKLRLRVMVIRSLGCSTANASSVLQGHSPMTATQRAKQHYS